MKRAFSLGFFGLLLLALVAGVMLLSRGAVSRGRRNGEATVDPQSKGKNPELVGVGAATGSSGAIGGSAAEVSSKRQGVAERQDLLRGWVVDKTGDPVEGARVTLVTLTENDLTWEPAWQEGEWGELDSPRTTTVSDGRGEFSFEGWSTQAEGEFALCASQAGYSTLERAVSTPLTSEEGIRLVLEPAAPLTVTVLGPDGTPASGATVDRYGVLAPTESGIAARYAHDSMTTDVFGVAELPWRNEEQVLVATSESAVSIPWRGHPARGMKLRLREALEVGGEVHLPDWSDLEYEGERRIQVVVQSGGLERTLATIRSVQEGDWGPVRIPRLPGETYTVTLEGSPIIPVREEFLPPTSGSRVRIDLDAGLGANVWIQLVDQDGEPIMEGEATLEWEWKGKGNHLTRHAGEDGFLNMWSIPPVRFDILAQAPGYARTEIRDSEVPESYIRVHLPKAGRLAGRCVHNGEPVSDFTVIVFQDLSTVWEKRQFEGRKDGSFELEAVPLGAVLVVASSDALPPCKPVSTTVVEGGVAEVVLNLKEGAGRSGVVLDAQTRKPIGGARIRRVTAEQLNAEDWWGSPVYTGDDGSFSLDHLGEGATSIEVSAEGYSSTTVRVAAKKGVEKPPIHVELDRPGTLSVQLLGLGPGQYVGCEATVQRMTKALPARPFDANGFLTYDEASPGRYRVQVTGGPIGELQRSVDFSLRPRERRVVSIRIGGPNRLSVAFDGRGVAPGGQLLWALVRYNSPGGDESFLLGTLDETGGFEAEGIEARGVWVGILSGTGQTFGAARGTFEGGNLHLRISGTDHPFRLRVVDGEGRTLSGVDVTVLDPIVGGRSVGGTTNAEGVLDLYGVPNEVVPVLLHHASYGDSLGGTIDGRLTSGELVLDAGATLRIRVENHGDPVHAAEANLVVGTTQVAGSVRRSDAAGLIVWENLGAGVYHVVVTRPGYWPATVEFVANQKSTAQVLEMRKQGALTLRIRSEELLPLQGMELELVDVTSGSEVGSWIAEGLVGASGDKTDTKGEIRYAGLPEGEFRVRIGGAAGRGIGVVTVSGGEESVVELVLGGA